MGKNIIIGLLVVALVGAVAWQGLALRELRREVAGLTGDSDPSSLAPAPAGRSATAGMPPVPVRSARKAPEVVDDSLNDRLTDLEQSVEQLIKASDYLMARGQIPLSSNRIVELQQKFLDINATTRDRLQALNLLQRNNGLNDAVIQGALAWVQSSTNTVLRAGVLRELSGSTNAFLREPLMKLAQSDSDARVRQSAVQSLGRFSSDPQVESLLWSMMRTEQDRRVQEQISEALREAPMSPSRVADLRNRATSGEGSLDERLTAFRALRQAGEGVADVSSFFAQVAQNTQDSDERARIFSAFDGVTDQQMKLPLVYGLQDASANVRARAADALSSYNGDPAVTEWLRYVSQNDTDPRVRREADEALREQQQAPRNRAEGGRGEGGRGGRFGDINPQGFRGRR